MTDHNSLCKRRTEGILLSVLGIMLNLTLFLLKYTAGSLAGSIAVTADGFNNLADTGSCILTLAGFWLGSKRPCKKYPMGYGRMEYLSGLLIALLVLIIGARMLLSSIGKILHPKPVDSSMSVIIILMISIFTKGAMYLYNRHFGKKLRSSAMHAAALDSLSDCIATLSILLSCGIERLCGFHADGYTGVLVAVCILYAGITSIRECADPLLGRKMDASTEKALHELIGGFDDVKTADNILLHDYGPDSRMITMNIVADHPLSTIPVLQREIREKLRLTAVISPTSYKNNDPCQHNDPSANNTAE